MNNRFLFVITISLAFSVVFFEESITAAFFVSADESSYKDADIISISGYLENVEDGIVFISIENPEGDVIFFEELKVKKSGKFSTLLIAGGAGWQNSGTYTLYASYGNSETQSSFSFEAKKPQIKERVPVWIKNNAKWWSDGQIEDSVFVSGIDYMIKKGIILIPNLPEFSVSVEPKIPDWVKKNASWWVEGLITEGDFVSGIEYLVEIGVIQV